MYDEIIDAEWECPFCGTKQTSSIQFKYGAMYVNQYKLGDKIRWNDGVIYEKRLPNGTGRVRGIVSCRNNWEDRWRRSHPGELGTPMNGQLLDARTPEQIAQFGCPSMMNIEIEFVDDVIERVSFSERRDDIFDDL